MDEAPELAPGMPGYVLRDWRVVDYGCQRLQGTDLWFRGPLPASGHPDVTVIGAAQTFGCLVDEPYPELLSTRLGLEVANLGYSGAGPSFFLREPRLMEVVNSSRMCVVQVMSGRSTENSLFANPLGLAHGLRRSDGAHLSGEDFYRQLLESELARLPGGGSRWTRRALRLTGARLPRVGSVVAETRARWIADYQSLLARIRVPTVLCWFSTRQPGYKTRYSTTEALLSDYPHLIDQQTLEAIQPLAHSYVECVSDRGRPQMLFDRFTGDPTTIDLANDPKERLTPSEGRVTLYEGTWSENAYYPTPEMHQDAASALADVIGEYLGL